jgi:hypothetical protein
VVGSTQASNVIPLVRCNEAASGIVTRELEPLKLNADPYFPPVLQVAFATVPLFPFPDPSVSVDPDPSSNEYDATSPAVADVPEGARTNAARNATTTIIDGNTRPPLAISRSPISSFRRSNSPHPAAVRPFPGGSVCGVTVKLSTPRTARLRGRAERDNGSANVQGVDARLRLS